MTERSGMDETTMRELRDFLRDWLDRNANRLPRLGRQVAIRLAKDLFDEALAEWRATRGTNR